jgi:3-phosphoshikimate 1-carboxyvinyltransferase
MYTFGAGPLRGEVRLPGDKSISHRALMLAALAPGTSTIESSNRGADVLATRDAIIALGADVDERGEVVTVEGGALHDPAAPIDARNSGTTSRLLMGLCGGQGITARFDGDESLRRRPMDRVARPLRAMGVDVQTADGCLPATVRGIRNPPGGEFVLELPSAQVKSAILFANLSAGGTVIVTGDRFSRDHTERMLRHFGRTIAFDGSTVDLEPGALAPRRVRVPGDFSGAAFFITAAAITPGSDCIVRDVGVNPTRIGLLDILLAMGADFELQHEREQDGEPIADVHVRYRPLQAASIDRELVVRAIDEIPIVAVAAAHANGTTRIRDAADLRAKESDRLQAIAQTLRVCGVTVVEQPDGLDITGGGARPPDRILETLDDHRIAMSIAALAAPTGPHAIDNDACIAVSFPGFIARWAEAQA